MLDFSTSHPASSSSYSIKLWLLLVFTGLSTSGFTQRIATLEVSLPHAAATQSVPAEVKRDGLTSLPDSDLSLVEVQGQLDNDYGGMVMISAPTNYNHPEPLRVWPETQNGRGDLFIRLVPKVEKA